MGLSLPWSKSGTLARRCSGQSYDAGKRRLAGFRADSRASCVKAWLSGDVFRFFGLPDFKGSSTSSSFLLRGRGIQRDSCCPALKLPLKT